MSARDDDDFAIFASAMADVQRSRPSARIGFDKAPPPPHARQAEQDERAVIAELLDGPDPDTYENGDTLSFRGDGIQDIVWRRLRRGGYRIEAELDLHGFNRERARAAVAAFLAHCQDHRHRCVRIIHGKGNGSPNSGPVIKRLLDGWLRRRRDVLAFTSARPHDGGTGAVYVLLRSL